MKEFYKGKKVLVTGNTGFKGSWLSLWLNQMGAEVYGISKDVPTDPSMFELVGLRQLIEHRTIDMLDFELLKEAYEEIQPDMVFHLAAQAITRISFEEPRYTIENNLMATVNLLECMRLNDRAVNAIFVTSDKCYENKEWVWSYRENDLLGGKDPYSVSKAACEIAISSYVRSFFNDDSDIRIATARAGNIFGGGDWSPLRLIPDCVRAWSNDEPIVLRHPRSTRPWQHVLEPLNGYLHLAIELNERPELHGQSFNFGPRAEENFTVAEMVDMMAAHWRGDLPKQYLIVEEDHSNMEAGLLRLNCDKAHALLNWKPVWQIDLSLKRTVEWYESYLSKSEGLMQLSLDQIEDFEKHKQTGDLET